MSGVGGGTGAGDCAAGGGWVCGRGRGRGRGGRRDDGGGEKSICKFALCGQWEGELTGGVGFWVDLCR